MSMVLAASREAPIAEVPASGALPSFDELYDEHVDRVFRALHRFGVADDAVEDAVQDVFVIAYRKLESFEGRSALSTWLYGIALQVARNYRRSARRRPETPTEDAALDGPNGQCLERTLEEAEAVRILHQLLDQLEDEKREVFVLAELEQLSAPEMAASLGVNVNTLYARVRAARAAFEQAVSRHRAKDQWRLK